MYYGSRKSPGRAIALAVMTLIKYPMALIFGGVSLLPLVSFPPWLIVASLPPFIVGLIVFIVRKNAEPKPEGQADTPDECWRLGDIYINPADPAIFVEKRDGVGFTFNLGNPWGIATLALFLAGIGALVAFLDLVSEVRYGRESRLARKNAGRMPAWQRRKPTPNEGYPGGGVGQDGILRGD